MVALVFILLLLPFPALSIDSCYPPLTISYAGSTGHFPVTNQEIVTAIKDAIEIWNKVTLKPAFQFVDGTGEVPIMLKQDERQIYTEELRGLILQHQKRLSEFEDNKLASERLQLQVEEHNNNVKEFQLNKKVVVENQKSAAESKNQIEIEIKRHNEELGILRNKINEINSIIAEKSKERRKLYAKESEEVTELKAELHEITNSYNEQALALNEYIKQHNQDSYSLSDDVSDAIERERELIKKSESLNKELTRQQQSNILMVKEINELGQKITTLLEQKKLQPPPAGVYMETQLNGKAINKGIEIYQFGTNRILVSILVHELGHARGLTHLSGESAVMHKSLDVIDFQNSGDITLPSLSKDDVMAMRERCDFNRPVR